MNASRLKIIAGPVLGVLAATLYPEAGSAGLMAGVVVWMAVWWMSEAVTIYFTALLPVVLFPLLGLLPMSVVAPLYMKDIIWLFIGGFLIAYGLERWNLHRRIALRLILLAGATPARVLMGFMLASYALSMWISNTATVAMLLPAVLAVVAQLDEQRSGRQSPLATPYLLGIAYAASVGGMATLVGTPTNIVFMKFYNERYTDPAVDFANWFAFGLPLSMIMLGVVFLVLRTIFRKTFTGETISVEYCSDAYRRLGPMTYEEKALSAFFAATVLLWFFLKDLAIGSVTIPGWTSLPPFAGYSAHINESTVAMLTACALFLFPSRRAEGGLIVWKDVQRIPVGVLFLFGGGFALAEGVETSGLSVWIAGHLSAVGTLHPVLIVLSLCLFMTFFTELTSNTAATFLLLPVIFAFAADLPFEPMLVFVPVVLSASCAFMLPVATPPNTIVFGSERLSIRDMMRAGIWLNLICALLITAASFTIVRWVY